MSGRVHQEDETKLKATVVLAAGNEIEVTQNVAADLKAAVDIATSYNPETEDDIIPAGEVRETAVALLYGYDEGIEAAWERLYSDSANHLYVNALQPVAACLKATVTQLAKDRTITGTATVTPSGDMARLAPYDRDLTAIAGNYGASLGAHALTERYRYTVPGDRIFRNTLMRLAILVASSDGTSLIQIFPEAAGVGFTTIDQLSTTAYKEEFLSSLDFYLTETQYFRARTRNTDSINHSFYIQHLGLEFDV